ncbi:GntR family transcriptional regulator [Rhodococcus sp. USK13]|uniref:GntR family transcriptional regulator n=1 Tax=Rhodococcus sp. USK13 TaxID=2806442 RepID=UPI001BCCB415|nr:GntR family transcriptional regulator [Rhodococcus sp. USK13]
MPESEINLTSRVESLLRTEIIRGRLAPDSPLRISHLAERFDSGPTPVREALSRLLPEGMVDFAPNRGFKVRGVSRDDLIDLTTARCAVESEALRLSMAHGTDEWASGIVAAQFRLRRQVGKQTDAWSRAEVEPVHVDFHRSLISDCRSPRLLDLAARLAMEHSRYIFLTQPAEAILPGTNPADGAGANERFQHVHDELTEIVLSGDVESAVSTLRAHLSLIVEVLDGLEFWSQRSG